ncbi:MAG: ATP-binding protein [Pseudomonadota bacterium]
MTDIDEDMWNSLPLPALIVSSKDRVLDINNAAEMFLNLSQKVLKSAPVWDRIHVDAPLEEVLERVREAQATVHINDAMIGTGTQPPVPCNVQVAPMQRTSGAVMILMEPRHVAERLDRAKTVKSAARSAIGMAEMLAHEIKNPLAGITGAAQLLSMNLKGDDRDLTDLIVAESRRIVKLLEQVEQFGNLSPPDRKPVNIHDLLDRARKSAQVGFAADIAIEEDYDPSLPPTFADGDQLLQVFLNLLKNASEACGGAGIIRIRTYYELSLRLRHKDGSGRALPLHVDIIDNGPGLPPELGDQIFEPFVSGRENGTGLGLALVSKIVSEHDGWIDVDSVPGRTAFRIALPIASKELEEES